MDVDKMPTNYKSNNGGNKNRSQLSRHFKGQIWLFPNKAGDVRNDVGGEDYE